MFIVLTLLVATVLQQMLHTSSSSSNPKCTDTAAVAFGFETNSILVFILSNLN